MGTDLGCVNGRDIYILAGQSNMSGRGLLSELPTFSYASRVYVYSNAGSWVAGAEPVDSATNQVDSVSADNDAASGPSMAFADAMVSITGRDVGLVPCAKGGSTMAEWRRDWRRTSLYGSCLARAREAEKAGTIRGLIFYQGEADTTDLTNATEWPSRFAEFVSAFRADIGIHDLPVVFTQLGPEPNIEPYVKWGRVQLSQQELADAQIPNLAMVSASDLPVQVDKLHLTTAGYVVLGKRYAKAMHGLLAG